MRIWMACAEDEEGMLWEEAITDFTRQEVEKIAREKWEGKIPKEYAVCLYECDFKDVLFRGSE